MPQLNERWAAMRLAVRLILLGLCICVVVNGTLDR